MHVSVHIGSSRSSSGFFYQSPGCCSCRFAMRERKKASEDVDVETTEGSPGSSSSITTRDSNNCTRLCTTSNVVQQWYSAGSFLDRVLHIMLLPLDLRGLAAFRILIGLVAVVETSTFIYWREAFLSDSGVCSRAQLLYNKPDSLHSQSLQVYFGVSDGLPLMLMLLAHLVAALATMVGYRTRTSMVCLWLFRMGLRSRLVYVGYSADGLIVASIFWGAYLPTGKRYSWDAAWSGLGHNSHSSHQAPVDSYLLLLELTIMYAFAGYYKTGPSWLEGKAVSQVLQGNMARSYLANVLLMQKWLCEFLSQVALRLEQYGWLALFVPHWLARGLTCCVLIGFHVSMWALIQVDLFQPAACSLLIGCLPAPCWNLVDMAVARFTSADPCNATCSCAQLLAETRCERDEDDDSSGFGKSGNTGKSVAVEILQRRSQGVGRVLLRIAAFLLMFLNLRFCCSDFQLERPGLESPPFCFPVLRVNSWLMNFGHPKNFHTMEHMEYFMQFLGLHQTFSMFSPNPPETFWWLRMTGVTQGGAIVAPWLNGRPNFDGEHNLSSEKKRSDIGNGLTVFGQRPVVPFASHRWLKLFEHAEFYNHCLKDFGKYMCRSWNERNTGNLTMAFFRVIKLWSPVRSPWDTQDAPSAEVISYHSCSQSHLSLAEQLREPREYTMDEICKQDHRLFQQKKSDALLPSCQALSQPLI